MFGVFLLYLASAVDILMSAIGGFVTWQVVLIVLAGLIAVLLPASRRPGWLTTTVRALVPATLSLAATAVLLLCTRSAPTIGPGEVALLLCLLLIAVRECTREEAVLSAMLLCIALLAAPWRGLLNERLDDIFFLEAVLFVLMLCVGVLGASLRSLDRRRLAAVADVRRAERMAIAADLHDFVAHHVTGILVQTRMARALATSEPARLDPVLEGVETAATEALAAMRRTVGVLRTTTDAGPAAVHGAGDPHRPLNDLGQLADLVEEFSRVGPAALLRRDPAVSDDLPPEVQAAAYRVTQEALTNVRRHAADATEVVVRLTVNGDSGRALRLTVTDDGRGGTRLPDAAHGGGFGLVGLTERVTALGGELASGPRPEGGWAVSALLPTGRTA
jgi:signal transduction histidine kinase